MRSISPPVRRQLNAVRASQQFRSTLWQPCSPETGGNRYGTPNDLPRVVCALCPVMGRFTRRLVLGHHSAYEAQKINAFATFILVLGLTCGAICLCGPHAFTYLYETWIGFMTASTLMSFKQALLCCALSFREGRLLALGGNTGNFVYDFFVGRELNPSFGSFYLNVPREGHLHRHGHHHRRFGFMLAIAFTWVPFTYSLQARYLAFKHVELGPNWTTATLVVNLTAYYILRDSNCEKNDFRNGINASFLVACRSSPPSNDCRFSHRDGAHPNYLDDVLMALAWSLPTVFDAPLTYFYVVYFAILLIHRQSRDDEHCHRKYGKDWVT
ncbi:putative ERG4 ERG24 ergosterol biosynthesis protein [Lyophyllum shimeji]|uniref:ERG4 ERG24 ergosterol biosynthesis protein n=1 Tax=Lyophyllum shimeji TaxID=47721 RepID=A0A9P3PS01_LYOSH|nr:putative ERG4 ERG24 ergosterol biosynthesis protein [Lyophyllum shimeji]